MIAPRARSIDNTAYDIGEGDVAKGPAVDDLLIRREGIVWFEMRCREETISRCVSRGACVGYYMGALHVSPGINCLPRFWADIFFWLND
jgi:hypothetical protein